MVKPISDLTPRESLPSNSWVEVSVKVTDTRWETYRLPTTTLIGQQGERGKSAYQHAVDRGFEGGKTAWLNSLQGEQGKSAYQSAVDNGYDGSETEWLESLQGKSAYQVAADQGFDGDEEAFIESLRGSTGDTGPAGKSAYEVALDNGFEGTEEEWLDSLGGSGGSFDEPPDDGQPYLRQNGEWVALDSLTLDAGTLDES